MGMYDRDWYRESYKEKEENTAGISVYIVSLRRNIKRKKLIRQKIIQLIKNQPTEIQPTKTQIKSRMILYSSLLTLVAPFSL